MSLHDPISPLRTLYVQKVLPAVYDDSLSYYEVLAKTQEKLNEVISDTNDVSALVLELQQAIMDFIHGGYTDTFEEYLDEWFAENADEFVQRLIDEGVIPEVSDIQNDLLGVHASIVELQAEDTSIRNDMVAADNELRAEDDSIRSDMVAADTAIRSDMNAADNVLTNTKVPYPVVGATPSYGTSGQVLATNADGTTEWQDPMVPSDAQAEQIITQWLNAHPEATTTVQDGAITTAKLANGAVTDEKLVQSGGVLSEVDSLKTATGYIDLIWESGAFNGSDGEAVANSARIRTANYVDTSIESISVSDGYENAIFAWDGNDEYKGSWNRTELRWVKSAVFGDADINFTEVVASYPNYKYRIVLKRSNNTNIQPGDGINLTYFPMSGVDFNEQNIESLSDRLAIDENLIDAGVTNIGVQGGFVLGNTGNGELIVSSTNNMVTPSLQEIDRSCTLTTDWTKYRIYQWELADGTWSGLGWKTSDISLEAGYVGRFVLRGVPSHDFTEEEQAEVNAVTVYVLDTAIKKQLDELFDELDERFDELEHKTLIGKSDFISICHQGYSDDMAINQSLLPGFALAAEHGFEFAETDVTLSSDNVVMCSHDSSFVDATTGDTIVIGEHTAAELRTYDYYGGTIATLDEVMAACKENRIGLVIDHATSANIQYVFPVIRKYGMQDNVIYLIGWAVGNPNYANNMYNHITSFCKRSRVMFMAGTSSLSEVKTFLSTLDTHYSKVDITLNHASYSTADIIALSQELPGEVEIAVWTIDNIETAKQYMPYVTAITSNKFSTKDIFD